MAFLHICFACQNGRHEDCTGDTPPMNQSKNGPTILGGKSCTCPVCRKNKREKNKPDIVWEETK